MIHIYYYLSDAYVAEIVRAAMVRSFSEAQVKAFEFTCVNAYCSTAVLINPKDREIHTVRTILSNGGKLLVLGRIGPNIADELGVILNPAEILEDRLAEVPLDPHRPFNTSPAVIKYSEDHSLGKAGIINPRSLCRYDFANEWNNLGYGRISVQGSSWDIACTVQCAAAICVAVMEDFDGRFITTYVALRDTSNGSALWINRPVGPVDSLEWRIVEVFFGEYRLEDLPCRPYLLEIPLGYRGAAVARLDCDQDVASARCVFDLYSEENIPLSLALLTGLVLKPEDMDLIRDIIRKCGAIVSHSVHHYPQWGRNFDTAFKEAEISKKMMERTISEIGPCIYAVSPFHQTPVFAAEALFQAGYQGFIGGILHNDPEFLFGRAGQVPFVKGEMVSHSQQCMVHGDCVHRYGNSIEVYKDSFKNHFDAGAIFGYLDHPFSKDYQYGWDSESERLEVHQAILRYINSYEGIWWCSLKDCLDFIRLRNLTSVSIDTSEKAVLTYRGPEPAPRVGAAWKGEIIAL